jgi:hypothetical protein
MIVVLGVRVAAGHVVGAWRGGVGPRQLAAAGHRVATGTHPQCRALLQRGRLRETERYKRLFF